MTEAPTVKLEADTGTASDVGSRLGEAVRSWVVGSHPECDLRVDRPTVSGRHCRLSRQGDGTFRLEDLGSTNGTFVNGRRIAAPVTVGPEDRVTLGRSEPLPWDELQGRPRPGPRRDPVPGSHPSHHRRTPPESGAGTIDLGPGSSPLLVGRDPACDVAIDHPMVSWHHARLHRDGDLLVVEDLGSTNGTFVEGRRVRERAAVRIGEAVGVAGTLLVVTAPGRLLRRELHGNLTVEGREVTVDVPGRRLVEAVSLTLFPGELVGLMGPSGAGKTTLMMALNGYTPPAGGRVLFNGQDLYGNFAQFRLDLGYVPQDDIIHRDLTVRQALAYTARLRLPRDTRAREIRRRIAKVLAQLGLEGTEDVLIGSPAKKGISGGQRKRVNLAMELLTDPSVLFLDEPTSGLSSEDALMVMEVLRTLADGGKTILLTIHQPSLEVFRKMDNLALLAKDPGSPEPARLAYYGPAYPDAPRFFSPAAARCEGPSPDEVLRGLARGKASDWVGRYEASPYQRDFVEARAGRSLPAAPQAGVGEVRRPAGLHQWWTLVRRNVAIKARDLWNTAILLVQAPIIAGLIVMVFGDDVRKEVTAETWASVATSLATTLFLLTIAAIWFGCSNSAREIVSEWAIYHRERMVNLKIPSFVGSKLAVLGGLSVVQCGALLGIVYPICDLRGDPLLMLAVLLASSLVGVGFGLLLSALAPSSEVAISLVPLILLPMVILGGIMQPAHRMGQPMEAGSHLMASQWAFEGLMVVESRERPRAPAPAAAAVAPADAPAGGSPGEASGASETRPQGDEEAPDMADAYFPEKQRASLPEVGAALGGMFVLLVAAIAYVLKSRDVHP